LLYSSQRFPPFNTREEERKLFWSWLQELGQYTEEDVIKWVNQILEGLKFLESVDSSHCYELDVRRKVISAGF